MSRSDPAGGSPNGPTRSLIASAVQRRRPTGQLRTEQYKNRNVVERLFARMQHWRGWPAASTYTPCYRSGVVLAAIVNWLKQS